MLKNEESLIFHAPENDNNESSSKAKSTLSVEKLSNPQPNRSLYRSDSVVSSPHGSSHHISTIRFHNAEISPLNFVEYLPYAYAHFNRGWDWGIVVSRLDLVEMKVLSSSKIKKNQLFQSVQTATSNFKQDSTLTMEDEGGNNVHIVAVHRNSNLVQLRFMNNKIIPREVFPIISLILQFHPHLSSIIINSGLHAASLYEVTKLTKFSQITEFCFDDASDGDDKFHILLETATLKRLSLARCNLKDKIVIKICQKLEYPQPASKSLCILNLSTNGITNVGAQAIGRCLRSNRTLVYLNLADNLIEDDGAEAILGALKSFCLNRKEFTYYQTSKCIYERDLVPVANKYVDLLTIPKGRSSSTTQRILRDKGKQKTEPKIDPINFVPSPANLKIIRGSMFGKTASEVLKTATEFAKVELPFQYHLGKLTKIGNVYYCSGNFALLWLNLSYNNLSYSFLENLAYVLENQAKVNEDNFYSSGGLIKVVIEGNPLPKESPLYGQIQSCLALRQGYVKRLPKKISTSKSTLRKINT